MLNALRLEHNRRWKPSRLQTMQAGAADKERHEDSQAMHLETTIPARHLASQIPATVWHHAEAS